VTDQTPKTAPELSPFEKTLRDWQRIAEESPDYDCWPAPIRGWEVVALIRHLNAQASALRVANDAIAMLLLFAETDDIHVAVRVALRAIVHHRRSRAGWAVYLRKVLEQIQDKDIEAILTGKTILAD
jgi:hypothetical protein